MEKGNQIQDEEAFGAQNLLEILYVNNIHLMNNKVTSLSSQSLFTDLGLVKLGEVDGVSTPRGVCRN